MVLSGLLNYRVFEAECLIFEIILHYEVKFARLDERLDNQYGLGHLQAFYENFKLCGVDGFFVARLDFSGGGPFFFVENFFACLWQINLLDKILLSCFLMNCNVCRKYVVQTATLNFLLVSCFGGDFSLSRLLDFLHQFVLQETTRNIKALQLEYLRQALLHILILGEVDLSLFLLDNIQGEVTLGLAIVFIVF